MRKRIALILLAGTSAFAFAAYRSSSTLSDFAKSINDAKTISATYVVQEVGGVAGHYSVDLQKPNLARIETPDRLIVADGNQISTLIKSQKTYYHQPETAADLATLFQTDALNPWSGFFSAGAYQSGATQDLGSVQKAGQSYVGAEAQFGNPVAKTVTYYLDPSDKIVRLEEIVEPNGNTKTTTILKTRSVQVGGAENPSLFTFAAPLGAQEVSYAEMQAAKWFTSLSEAKAAAKSLNRKIFVDFFATWCGPCKMLEADVLDTSKFKDIASQKLVLLRIDVDAQKDVAAQYGIDAMPTQEILDADGNVVSKTVGYGDPAGFYSWLNPNLG